jgi:PD-(D/E)XK nuclease superfamily
MNDDKAILELIEEWKPKAIDLKEMKGRYEKKTSFNVFRIISATYYRENFHSQIIYKILIEQEDNVKNKFLNLFLKMLNNSGKKEKINFNDFLDSEIKREYCIDGQRRIDLLIKDEKSKKAIIIENKMNNAVDQNRQIPDYYNFLKKERYEVISIVYLPMVGNKLPSTNNWTQEEINEICDKIVTIPAFNPKGTNLSNDWIDLCIAESNQIDFKSTLNQYKDLIMDLTNHKVLDSKMEDFYTLASKTDNYDTILSIIEMHNSLLKYRADKISEVFAESIQPKIFEKNSCFKPLKRDIWVSKLQDYQDKKIDLWLRVEVSLREYKITINEGKTFKKDNDKLSVFVKSRGLEGYFKRVDEQSWHSKEFSFPNEEDALHKEVRKIIEAINKGENMV